MLKKLLTTGIVVSALFANVAMAQVSSAVGGQTLWRMLGSAVSTVVNSYKVGIGTTTPWAMLSVNPNALGTNVPSFVVGSSTGTKFIVDNAGNVGVGTTSPSYKFSVGGATGDTSGNGYFTGNLYANNFYDLSTGGSTCIGETAGLLGTSNCVASVASAGGSLTVSSPTGAVDVSFNLAHANSFTALQTFKISTTTQGDCYGPCSFGASATTTIASNGKIGYGTTTPTEAITVVGGGIMTTENAQSTTTSITVNMTSQNQSLLQIGTSATTVTLTGAIAGQAKRIVICNPTSAASTISWATTPAGKLLWSGGTAPTQTTTANKCDVYTFTVSQGTSTAATSPIILGGFIQNF